MRPTRHLRIAGLSAIALAVVLAGFVAGARAAPAFTIVDLGTLGGDASAAAAVGPNGQIVGSAITAGGRWHSFSWTQAGKMIDLGTLGDPYVNSYSVGVNANGQVIGFGDPVGTNDPQHAFFWTPAGGMVDLGTLDGDTIVEPSAINASGQVVGSSWTPNTQAQAFFWTQAGRMVDLRTLGGTGAWAGDVNDGGEVVGYAGTGHGVHAFRWTQSGGMVDLRTLGGSWSEAWAISERGHVVGWSLTPAQQRHAFLWAAESGMVDLGTLGGAASEAVAVNDSGQVAGYGLTSDGARHAFSWTKSGGMIDVGTLGGSSSEASSITAGGQIVGWSSTSGGAEHAFSWTASGGIVDLGTLGGSTSRAVAVNDRGQIVGYAFKADETPRAVLWAPATAKPVIEKPAAMPAKPVAGKRFIVSFKVTRSDTGAPLTTGTMLCTPSFNGKAIRHAESFKNGTARVSFLIPASAKGKLLRVKLTIRTGDQSTTSVATFHVH